jgi:hypothetical protein
MTVLETLCQGGAKHGTGRSADASGGSLNLDRTLKL